MVDGFVRVAGTGDLAPGEVIKVRVGDLAIAVYNLDGTFYATDDRCSHDEASLSEGRICGDQIECPRHGARFDIRTGKNKRFPAVVPVKTYEVRIEGDEVLVRAS